MLDHYNSSLDTFENLKAKSMANLNRPVTLSTLRIK